MFVLYFCRQKVPNKRWRGAAAEQQQSRWQRRRSQADNVLPRLPQGPRLRRSVLVWVGSRPGLLGSAVSRCRPSVLSCLSAALDQCAGPDTDTSAGLYCTVTAGCGRTLTSFSLQPGGGHTGPDSVQVQEGPVGRKEGGVEQEQYNNKLVVIVLSSYQSLLLYTSNNAAILFSFFHFVVIEVTPLLPTSRVLCGSDLFQMKAQRHIGM